MSRTMFLVIMVMLCVVPTAIAGSYRGIAIGEGDLGRYRWGAEVLRDDGRRGGQRPCVLAGLLDRRPPGYPPELVKQTFLKECSTLASRRAPNIVSVSFGEGQKEVTSVGMVVEPSVWSVRLDLGSREPRDVQLKLLNDRQRAIVGVRQLRYAAFVSRGPFCISHIVAYGKARQELYSSPAESCPSH